MKNLISLLAVFGLSAISLWFLVCALRAGSCADSVWHPEIYLKAPLGGEDVLRLMESEEDFAAWGELKEQVVADPDMGRRTRADVLSVLGPVRLALPAHTALDSKGCLLGERTAWELFGSTSVVGDDVVIAGELRTVRAVIPQPERGVIVAGALGTEKISYDRVAIESTAAADAEAFCMRNALDGRLLRFDCLRGAEWLAELVPGKWSDFSGWEKNLEQKREDIAFLSRIEKTFPEYCYERACRRCVCFGGAAGVCILAAARILAGLCMKFHK